MMLQSYYTYRIHITHEDAVRIEKLGGDNKDRDQPTGIFECNGDKKRRIQELHLAAHENKLTMLELQELGEKLFEALFDSGLQRDFFNFYGEARKNQAFLRIELDVDEQHLPHIAALPWEFMRVPKRTGYSTFWLSTNPHLIFSRRRSRGDEPLPIHLAEDEPLRIALAVAAPNGLDSVKYDPIWKELQNWATINNRRVKLLDIINPATPRTIDKMLEQRPHICHFIGHGRLKDETQSDVRQIALVDTMLNDPLWLGAQEFSELFDRHQPGIVLLQTCESATSSNSEAFVSVASHIVQQNIPVVVAMQYEVSNVTAQTFSIEFYERLGQGEPVDKAAQEGRRSIALGPSRYTTRDFATPVIFMRVKDGRLFLSPLSQKTDDGQDIRKQIKIVPLAEQNEIRQNFLAKLKRIQDTLLEEQKRFIKGEVIYQDSCDLSINAVKELDELLRQPLSISIAHDYSFTVPLINVNNQEKDLGRSLDTFRAICPPSTSYKHMSKQHYDDKCETVGFDLNSLVENINDLIARLEAINMQR